MFDRTDGNESGFVCDISYSRRSLVATTPTNSALPCLVGERLIELASTRDSGGT